MKRVLCPDDSAAAPDYAARSSSDESLTDFRHWLSRVQAKLHVEPTAPTDRPPTAPGGSLNFPAQSIEPEQSA